MTRLKSLLLAASLMLLSAAAQAFDHSHTAWNTLLKQHVVLNPAGTASAVRYAALKKDRSQLKAYLDAVSAVTPADYASWPKPQQLAFLINAYNAYTVELILTRYPDLDSIKDLGSLFSSPWKQTFFTLLGQEESLDGIEHGRIRAAGVFDDPRIHAAVVCASIGCPMLRNEAFVAERLDIQLEDGMRRFLSDRGRNRFDTTSNTLYVSKIFDWYAEDFTHGHRGFDSLQATFAHYAEALADTPEAAKKLRASAPKIEHLDYDWRLNDAR
ncbi:MAG: DUF547 domain-containing protein [Denitromonas halophila]|nr:MAG: DUF547 domain-containing protein [Denitromonas halophila]TVT72018.1 MAG: DUF547 domain-containing protein [Denitromonas halophila]